MRRWNLWSSVRGAAIVGLVSTAVVAAVEVPIVGTSASAAAEAGLTVSVSFTGAASAVVDVEAACSRSGVSMGSVVVAGLSPSSPSGALTEVAGEPLVIGDICRLKVNGGLGDGLAARPSTQTVQITGPAAEQVVSFEVFVPGATVHLAFDPAVPVATGLGIVVACTRGGASVGAAGFVGLSPATPDKVLTQLGGGRLAVGDVCTVTPGEGTSGVMPAGLASVPASRTFTITGPAAEQVVSFEVFVPGATVHLAFDPAVPVATGLGIVVACTRGGASVGAAGFVGLSPATPDKVLTQLGGGRLAVGDVCTVTPGEGTSGVMPAGLASVPASRTFTITGPASGQVVTLAIELAAASTTTTTTTTAPATTTTTTTTTAPATTTTTTTTTTTSTTTTAPATTTTAPATTAPATTSTRVPPPSDLPVLRVADAWANEGDHGVRRIVFRLRLSRPAAGGERVLVHTVAATATAGTDFRSLASVEVVFPAGARFVDVAVDVYGDRRDEADEVLGLVATTPDRVTIGDGLGVGVIRDDDRRCGPPRRW